LAVPEFSKIPLICTGYCANLAVCWAWNPALFFRFWN
jgi:hypothetical protein